MPHEHYQQAEELLESAKDWRKEFNADNYNDAVYAGVIQSQITQLTLEAQVHATLATVGSLVSRSIL